MKYWVVIVLFGILADGFLASCSREAENPQIRIALSKGSPVNSYANYYSWVKSLDSNAICLDMYDMPIDSAMLLFRDCSGLILTGGTDINPALYDQAGDSGRCMTIDDYRDELEVRLIDSALAWHKPILGICRGHQMLNVYFGGSLIIDIPSDYGPTVAHRCEDFTTCFHPLIIDENSMLHEITNLSEGTVNSNHHQGIRDLATELRIVARAPDSLPESVEWAEPKNKVFLLGVQWHPERLGLDNPLSKEVGVRFIEACRE